MSENITFDRARMLFLVDDEDAGEGYEVPAVFEVCGRCDGHGKHDHPAFSNGITFDEWNGPGWSYEDQETYLSGGYDVQCEECKGDRVVPAVAPGHENSPGAQYMDRRERDRRAWQAEIESERRMLGEW
jgi:hypothetical protein